MTGTVLLVDDDAAVREALAQTLELAGFTPVAANSFVACKDRIAEGFPGVIVTDIRMPGRDGFHLLDYAHAQDPDLPVILLTGEGDIPMAVKAMSAGAFDFLEKPCAPGDLTAVVERALNTRALVLENRRLRAVLTAADPAARMLFGRSRLADALRDRVRIAASANTDVLVSGPPGSGVSKVAEVIHLSSPRSKGPFVKRAGQGLNRAEIEAMTDSARGGTAFIDEIGALALDAQLALADLLDAGLVRLVGGTTQSLEDAVAEGRMAAELFYRLNVMQVRIPAIADRPEDIADLFTAYVAQAAEQSGLPVPGITADHIADLMARDWPGNARALMSEAMRFVLGLQDDDAAGQGMGLVDRLARVERSMLEEALRQSRGQATAAAEALQLPRKTFYDKLAKHGLRAEAFRS